MKNAVSSHESKTSRLRVPAWSGTVADVMAMMGTVAALVGLAMHKPNSADATKPATPAVKPADQVPHQYDALPEDDRYTRLPLA